MTQEELFKKLVAHCKEYGFVFPSSEIYDGLGAVYDYGQNGVELKNNIKRYWWDSMVKLHENIVGIDAAIFMHPRTWEASGHVSAFNDPLIDNRDSKKRYRADVLIEDWIAKQDEKVEKEIATDEELQLFQQAKNACYWKGSEASAAADRPFREPEVAAPPIPSSDPASATSVTNAIIDRGRVLLPGKAPLLYLVYDSADVAWAEKLKKSFFLSEKNGLVEIFDMSKIPPGAKREELLPQVHRFAKVIAYLASSDLLSWLDFREMHRLSPNARHIPVLLRPCSHQEAFGGLVSLPRNGAPITQWSSTDSAMVEVVQGLKAILAA